MNPEPLFIFVGSRRLKALPTMVVTFVSMLPEGAIIGLRKPRTGKPGAFERIVAWYARTMNIRVRYFEPEGPGRASTFYRDIEMVRGASCVLAFFIDEEMSGGTEHVVEKAMDQMVPVYSYGIKEFRLFGQAEGEGELRAVMIGSFDPDDAWGHFAI